MARSLGKQYVTSVPVEYYRLSGRYAGDRGIPLQSPAQRAGNLSYNAHKTIYVVTPETHSTGQMVFRDNIQPMIRGKHVLF